MSSYNSIIEIILLFLTIYLTQTITGLSENQIQCLDRMDGYCRLLPPDNEDNYDPHNVTPELIQKWLNISWNDCGKAEVLRWKSGDPFGDDLQDYRKIILELVCVAQDTIPLPADYCGSLHLEGLDLINCTNYLLAEFGATEDNIFKFAVSDTTLDNEEYGRGRNFARMYLEKIAELTYVEYRPDLVWPYQYCIDKYPDDPVSITYSESPENSDNISSSNS